MHKPTEVLCCQPGQHWGLIRPPHTFGLVKYHQNITLGYRAIREEINRQFMNSINVIPHRGNKICHFIRCMNQALIARNLHTSLGNQTRTHHSLGWVWNTRMNANTKVRGKCTRRMSFGYTLPSVCNTSHCFVFHHPHYSSHFMPA